MRHVLQVLFMYSGPSAYCGSVVRDRRAAGDAGQAGRRAGGRDVVADVLTEQDGERSTRLKSSVCQARAKLTAEQCQETVNVGVRGPAGAQALKLLT